jgi:hypothetical protein
MNGLVEAHLMVEDSKRAWVDSIFSKGVDQQIAYEIYMESIEVLNGMEH